MSVAVDTLPIVLMGSQVGADPAEHPRWDGDRIRPYDEAVPEAGLVVEYDGRFDLCWLWPGEEVASAGDDTGACVIYGPTGERRVNIGDKIEVAALEPAPARGSHD